MTLGDCRGTAYGFTINLNMDFQESGWLIGKIELFCQLEIEQIGASLTTTNDVLGRSFASFLFSSGSNGKLTNINLSSVAVEIEPVKNLTFQSGLSYRTLESASPTFSLDYYTDAGQTVTKVQ
jgi:hypothetical protein